MGGEWLSHSRIAPVFLMVQNLKERTLEIWSEESRHQKCKIIYHKTVVCTHEYLVLKIGEDINNLCLKYKCDVALKIVYAYPK